MRVALSGLWLLLLVGSASAQSLPCATLPAYDPYKPSHLAIMREYGGTALAQAPLSTLLKLDPYVPSQGELLRQLGRAIPIWATYPFFPLAPMPPVPMFATPDCQPMRASMERDLAPSPPAAPLTRFSDVMMRLDRDRTTTDAAAPSPRPSARSVARTPGVSIQYAGRTWVSAGSAVPFRDSEFMSVGESGGAAVYRRAGTKDDLIFVPTTPGMVAPFRLTR